MLIVEIRLNQEKITYHNDLIYLCRNPDQLNIERSREVQVIREKAAEGCSNIERPIFALSLHQRYPLIGNENIVSEGTGEKNYKISPRGNIKVTTGMG